jgi:probable HAF family extracellular repeat protein
VSSTLLASAGAAVSLAANVDFNNLRQLFQYFFPVSNLKRPAVTAAHREVRRRRRDGAARDRARTVRYRVMEIGRASRSPEHQRKSRGQFVDGSRFHPPWQASTLVAGLGGRNSRVLGLSDQGAVVGTADLPSGTRHAFLTDNTITLSHGCAKRSWI